MIGNVGKILVRFTLVGLFVFIRSNVFSRRVGLVTSCVRPLSLSRFINSL